MGRHMTAAERDERYNFIISRFADTPSHDLQMLVGQKYNIKPNTARQWMAKARKICQELYHEDRAALIAKQAQTLDSIIHNCEAPFSARCTAIKLFNQMFGLNAPIQFETNIQNDTSAMQDPELRKMHLDFIAKQAAYNAK